jgi:hypothetical protein
MFLADYRGLSLSYPEAPLLYAIYGAAACYVRNANLFNDWHVFPHGEIWDIPPTFAELMYKNLVGFVRGPYTPCLAYIQALVISHYLSTSFDSWKDGWFLNCLVRMIEWLFSFPDKYKTKITRFFSLLLLGHSYGNAYIESSIITIHLNNLTIESRLGTA